MLHEHSIYPNSQLSTLSVQSKYVSMCFSGGLFEMLIRGQVMLSFLAGMLAIVTVGGGGGGGGHRVRPGVV